MHSRWLAYALVVGSMSLGVACKGGSPAFIMVLRTSPEDRSTNVQVDTRIGFQINANIDPDTLTNDTFFVTDPDGTRVEGTLVVDADEPDVAVLTLTESLAVITEFTATITTGLASTGGATLDRDFQWRFTTLDSAWGEDNWLEQIGTGSSDQHQIAIDAQSNALAVWEYEETTGTRIWASHYTRVDLWGEPEPIDDGNEPPSNPRLAIDEAGNGFAVWRQRSNIWTNRYSVDDEAWGTPALLQSVEITSAGSPSVAADAAGNAIAVWVQQEEDSPNQVVWASRYERDSGNWSPAGPIDPMPTPLPPPGGTSVGMDDAGNAIAVWARQTAASGGGIGGVLWANRYVAGMGWDVAAPIKPDPDTHARDERLTVGPNGDAFVIWVQNAPAEGDRNDIYATRFSGGAWDDEPTRIDNHDGDKKEPDIAVDGAGVVYAVWSQSDLDFENIWANRYAPAPGPGWGTPELIEPPNDDIDEDGDAEFPRVGVNAAGNVFVVWSQVWQDWRSVWSNRRDPEDAQWMPMRTELIESSARAARMPKIAVDDNRHAHAVWLHNLASGRWVRTNRFE